MPAACGQNENIMGKVTGIGGIFIKCKDVEQTKAWYAKHLGLQIEPWGVQFNWQADGHDSPYSIMGFFSRRNEYFTPSDQPFMINFRVDNLDALLEKLRADGIELIGEPSTEEFGKFAWIMDPEGNKLELWEQTS